MAGGPVQLDFSRIVQETTWATDPGSGYTGIPWRSYDVAQSNVLTPQDEQTGAIDIINVDPVGQDIAGSAEARVYPDNATLLLKTIPGIPRVTLADGCTEEVHSFTTQFFRKSYNKYYRHTGMKCNQVEISCTGPDGELLVSYDFQGKLEEEVSSFTKPVTPDQASFLFNHTMASGTSLITIGGTAEPNVESFRITVPNNMRPGERRDENGHRLWIDAGIRGDIAVELTLRSATTWANDYHGLVRGLNRGLPMQFQFNYPGTGSPVDTVTILLPLVVLAEVRQSTGIREAATITLSGTAKKSSGDAIQITVS